MLVWIRAEWTLEIPSPEMCGEGRGAHGQSREKKERGTRLGWWDNMLKGWPSKGLMVFKGIKQAQEDSTPLRCPPLLGKAYNSRGD